MTAQAIQMPPTHFGSIPDRQTAIPRSTLPMKLSAMTNMKMTIKSAPTSIHIASSMSAKYARPMAGAAKVDHPLALIKLGH